MNDHLFPVLSNLSVKVEVLGASKALPESLNYRNALFPIKVIDIDELRIAQQSQIVGDSLQSIVLTGA